MTHPYVWHASFICVTWLIHIRDMTQFICVTWLNQRGWITHRTMQPAMQSHIHLHPQKNWLSHVKNMNWIMSHIWMGHATRTNESFSYTMQPAMQSHIHMHTQQNDSCYTYENESRQTTECPNSYTCIHIMQSARAREWKNRVKEWSGKIECTTRVEEYDDE